MSATRISAKWSFLRSAALPPAPVLTLQRAMRRFHFADETLRRLVKEGHIRAGIGRSKTGQECIVFSYRDCWRQRERDKEQGLPADAEPIRVLCRELGVCYETVRIWCKQPSHPALGRAIRSGVGRYLNRELGGDCTWHGLLVSRGDLTTCVEAMREPCFKTFPGQAGIWLADGVYRDENGAIEYTDRKAEAIGITPRTMGSKRALGIVRSTRRIYPVRRRQRVLTWSVVTTPESEVKKALLAAKGQTPDDGRWVEKGELWRDAEGMWYADKWIDKKAGCKKGGNARNNGNLTISKRVPHWDGGRKVTVTHESEVYPLVGLATSAPSPATPPTPSFNGSFNSETKNEKRRDPYKAKKHSKIMRLIQRHMNRGKPLAESLQETAIELGLKVGTVKTVYYRKNQPR